MASLLCRSSCLTNLYIQRVTVLDIKEVITSDANNNKEWAYVISVTWSDDRENKIFRKYSMVSDLYSQAYRIRYASKQALAMANLAELPKVPARGFFEWSTIKLMIKNQPKVDLFLKVLISFPSQISRQMFILDFFESNEWDRLNITEASLSPSSTTDFERCSPAEQSKDDIAKPLLPARTSAPENQLEDQPLENGRRSRSPPNSLPLPSCFEPDDDISNDKSGYQTLLEDITSLELYEDYGDLYQIPLNHFLNFQNNMSTGSTFWNLKLESAEEMWMKECEEIISPYSPNKAYFHLVHVLENQWL